jgi:hypothetical protein
MRQGITAVVHFLFGPQSTRAQGSASTEKLLYILSIFIVLSGILPPGLVHSREQPALQHFSFPGQSESYIQL